MRGEEFQSVPVGQVHIEQHEILSIIGPALGIGILAGMSSSAIGRNPDAGEQIRSLAVLMAAFAEGLGVIALVVGLLIALL